MFFQLFWWYSRPSEVDRRAAAALKDRLDMTKGVVGEICSLSGVPGASIGIVHNGSIVHTFNYGKSNVEANIAMTSDTVLGIGSVTKSFISAAMSSLVDRCEVSWETTVKQVLPEFEQVNPFVEETLTISDILSHRSGLAGFGDMNMAFQGDGDMLFPRKSLLNLVKRFPCQFPLRSDWSYFVWGYALAGKVIEELTGDRLHKYIKNTLLQPLGLNATTFDPQSVDRRKFAKPYAGLSDGTAFPLLKIQAFKDTFFEASGGLYSSLNDMMRWSKAMLDAIKSKEPKESVIKDVESIISNHVPIENPSIRERSYGYGWVRTQLPGVVGVIGDNVDLDGGVRNHPPLGSSKDQPRLMLYHQGSTVGYYAFIALFPKSESAVVVLTNSIAISDAADWIARVMIKALFDLQDDHKDYVALAKRVNTKAIKEYEVLAQNITAIRATCTKMDLLDVSMFVGRYVSPHKPFHIDILPDPSNDAELVFRFQGLKDQTYKLRHFCQYQFEWALTHDESKRRGRYHNAELGSYVFEFEMDEGNRAISFSWANDPLMPKHKEQFIWDNGRSKLPVDDGAQTVLGITI
ncbi:hypothetical protein NM208_g9289 [Fusarium decemcellulare]|uniref:Uncharacterized protein n=1 Tax=Fusarium decemcellulare TaxID=57161 RepID=A0ACC1S289_9HYPO|nr:hypothetical protein NM208_g9289 [Fusarium decemcellulare]